MVPGVVVVGPPEPRHEIGPFVRRHIAITAPRIGGGVGFLDIEGDADLSEIGLEELGGRFCPLVAGSMSMVSVVPSATLAVASSSFAWSRSVVYWKAFGSYPRSSWGMGPRGCRARPAKTPSITSANGKAKFIARRASGDSSGPATAMAK